MEMKKEKKFVRHKIIEDYLKLQIPNEGTRYQYRSHLNKFFRFLEKDPETYFSKTKVIKDYQNDVLEYWQYMMKKHNAKSIPPQLSTIRNFLDEYEISFREKFWKNIAKRGLGNDSVREDRIPTLKELQTILNYGEIVDRAYCLVMCSSGIRESELCKVTMDDIDFESDPVMIKISAKIAKNKKKRITFMSDEARDAVLDWMRFRKKYVATNLKKFAGLKRYLENKYSREINGVEEDRIFPWTPKTARYRWNKLLEKAELNEKDKATGDYVLHLYVLRKYFETKMKKYIPEPYIRVMQGHTGYMKDAYFRPTNEEIAEQYKKGMTALYVYKQPANAEEIMSLQKQINDLQNQVQNIVKTTDFYKDEVRFERKAELAGHEPADVSIDVLTKEYTELVKESNKPGRKKVNK